MVTNPAVCPATFKPGCTGYAPRAVKEVFGGRTMPVQFPYELPPNPVTYHLKIEKRKYQFTDLPSELTLDVFEEEDRAANEQLSRQLAAQLFQLPVIASALTFLQDGRTALISRNIPVTGNMLQLAILDGHTPGPDAQYRYSYHGISLLIDKYFPAPIPAKELLFRMVAVHYLLGNGEAHLRTFQFVEDRGENDFSMAPLSSVCNTALHGDAADLALLDGLYLRDFEKISFKTLGFYGYDDIYQFGLRMNLVNFRVKRFLDLILTQKDEVLDMIVRSYLSDAGKRMYAESFLKRQERLSTSYSGLYKPVG